MILFFILYGVTGVVPLFAALYLLLRRGNAFAPDITPPVRLRCWAASFFAVAALGHVWWLLFYVLFHDPHSMDTAISSTSYVVVVLIDCLTLPTTLAGTLLAMLQDRRRSVRPVIVAMIPVAVLGAVLMVRPNILFLKIAIMYVLSLYVVFTVYMVSVVRRYRQWLNDNYADLENKKVWLSQAVTLGCLLLFILYFVVGFNSFLSLYFMHFTELVMFVLLLWRVETLPQLNETQTKSLTSSHSSLTPDPFPKEREAYRFSTDNSTAISNTPLLIGRGAGDEATTTGGDPVGSVSIDLAQFDRMLAEHCVATHLYLQHDLTLQQLARAIGTNRFYLSQYFSRQGITYNTYINNLRINHFIGLCQEAAAARQPIIAKQLASDSGYRSYSTFSLAFKQRTGKSVTAWLRDTEGDMA